MTWELEQFEKFYKQHVFSLENKNNTWAITSSRERILKYWSEIIGIKRNNERKYYTGLSSEQAVHYHLGLTGDSLEHSIEFQKNALAMTPEERADAQIKLFMTQEFIDNNPEYVEKRKKSMMIAASDAARSGGKGQQAARAYDAYERLPEIKVPTLIIHGEADVAFLPENARILASRIPHSELVTFPNTGHALLEAGNELYKVMKDFLTRNSQK